MLHWRDLISDVASCSWLMKTLRPKRIKLKEDSDFFKIISILFLLSRHKIISIYKSYSWESTRTVERKNTKVINKSYSWESTRNVERKNTKVINIYIKHENTVKKCNIINCNFVAMFFVIKSHVNRPYLILFII